MTKSSEETITAIPHYISSEKPELFFGLVGAVGTDLSMVGKQLGHELAKVGYVPEIIHLSKLLPDLEGFEFLASKMDGREDKRIHALMDAGDKLRTQVGRNDAMALLGIAKVRDFREEKKSGPESPVEGTAYIFHSHKHPDELSTLRDIYGPLFFSIAAYCPKSTRIQRLANKIAKSTSAYAGSNFREEAEELVSRDEKEVGVKQGQNLRDTFPQADAFVDATHEDTLSKQLERIVQIIFSHRFKTPTKDEISMFHAKAAALRSADLARQVGAVITTKSGDVLASGCNEVPKAGGGSIWAGEDYDIDEDDRDFQIGYDSTARMKSELIIEILERFQQHNWFREEFLDIPANELGAQLTAGEKKEILADTRVTGLIEFGRMVHAEMSAITNSAQRGLSIDDGVLYCTTFPCHMCARHIIAAGVRRVVFIEPYPKSLAQELYPKSIVVDGNSKDREGKVSFETFVGIAPRRFIELFEMHDDRKSRNGHVIKWEEKNAKPSISSFSSYTYIERAHLRFLASNGSDADIIDSASSENNQ